jgi:hypothetical protein
MVYPKVVDGECREFVVLPPLGTQFEDSALHKRIVQALSDEFSDLHFSLVCVEGNDRDVEFTVVPIIEERSGRQTAHLPSEELLSEIGQFLAIHFASIPAPKLN